MPLQQCHFQTFVDKWEGLITSDQNLFHINQNLFHIKISEFDICIKFDIILCRF